MEEKPREDLDKVEIHTIGELEGTPVYYHEEQDKESVAVSFAPINEDPNAGRIIMMPDKIETKEVVIAASNESGELYQQKIDASKFKLTDGNAEFETAKPTGDPTKPYYVDNGEPWVPFHTDYKAGFIVTGIKDFNKFVEIHGETTKKRITEKLNQINGK